MIFSQIIYHLLFCSCNCGASLVDGCCVNLLSSSATCLLSSFVIGVMSSVDGCVVAVGIDIVVNVASCVGVTIFLYRLRLMLMAYRYYDLWS
jgi:hypothetical protein